MALAFSSTLSQRNGLRGVGKQFALSPAEKKAPLNRKGEEVRTSHNLRNRIR